MFKRNRKEFRSLDDLPLIRSVERLYAPHGPELAPSETLHFDFAARRSAVRMSWDRLWDPSRDALGRLTVTNQRLRYATRSRSWNTAFVERTPSDVGTVEFPLSAIRSIRSLPWSVRFFCGLSWLPPLTMVEITLSGGERYRFGDFQKKPWERALRELATAYPLLLEDEHA